MIESLCYRLPKDADNNNMEQQPTFESLSRKIDSIQVLLIKVLDLLSNEKEQQIRKKEEKDVIREMPPIRNSEGVRPPRFRYEEPALMRVHTFAVFHPAAGPAQSRVRRHYTKPL